MARSQRWTDAVVGMFVVLGAITILGATLWARQAHLAGDERIVVARFRDVGSAGVGASVVVRGVHAGRIATLDLGEDGWVRARLRLDPEIRLPHDPVVVLGAVSLFGEWQATIAPRSAAPEHPDVRRQLTEAAGERDVLAGATLPDVTQLTAVAGRIADDVGAVSARVRATFDDTAASRVRETVANAAALSATLATTARRQAGAIDALSVNLRTGARALAVSGEAIQRTASRADSATASGDLQRAVRDAATTAAELRAAAEQLRALVHRSDGTRARVDVTIEHVDSLLGRVHGGRGTVGRLVTDSSLYRNADALLVELRALVADVRQHPRRYVNVRLF